MVTQTKNQPLTVWMATAVREALERRKASGLGTAKATGIYDALRWLPLKTKNEQNARRVPLTITGERSGPMFWSWLSGPASATPCLWPSGRTPRSCDSGSRIRVAGWVRSLSRPAVRVLRLHAASSQRRPDREAWRLSRSVLSAPNRGKSSRRPRTTDIALRLPRAGHVGRLKGDPAMR
jgi:hypothetical protein